MQNKAKSKVFFSVIACSMLLLGMASCSTETYADKRKAEKAAFSAYVSSHNLEFSTDSATLFNPELTPVPWPENLYFQTNRGVYIRLTVHDTTQLAITDGVSVTLYYDVYDLSDNLVGTNKYSREGEYFVFTSGGSTPCSGWNDAVACLRHGSEAEILIDSQLGTDDQYDAVETLHIKFYDIFVKK